jgi:hypothetical protein
VDGEPFIVVDHHFFPEHFEIAACASFVFHEEGPACFDRVEDIGGDGVKGLLVDKRGDKIEGRGGRGTFWDGLGSRCGYGGGL